MGFFDNLGGKIVGEVKEFNAEVQKYYERSKDMYDDWLIDELNKAKRYNEKAKALGYMKGAKERGLI